MPIQSTEVRFASGQPDRLVLLDDDVSDEEGRFLALDAVYLARQLMPRVTGASTSRLEPISGQGWFGIYFPDSHVWFAEHGTKPHTMTNLAGKTIPMWVDDHDGSTRRKNPKAETRTTADGRVQVKIFRKAAPIGATRSKRTRDGRVVSTVASYPGAPGRISRRTLTGEIDTGNVGVRWRHPGLRATNHLNQAISQTAFVAGLQADVVYVLDAGSWEDVVSGKMKGLI